MIIVIATAAIAVMFLLIFNTVDKVSDPFQENINKLIKRKSAQEIRDAGYRLYKMGPSIVPRLIGELNVLTNKWTKEQIYTSCNEGWIPGNTPDHLPGRTALFRSDMYSLISALDTHAYVETVMGLCRSNDPDLCFALTDACSEELLKLPTNEFFILTSTLAAKQGGVETDEGERLCITNFFNRLEFTQSHLQYYKDWEGAR